MRKVTFTAFVKVKFSYKDNKVHYSNSVVALSSQLIMKLIAEYSMEDVSNRET